MKSTSTFGPSSTTPEPLSIEKSRFFRDLCNIQEVYSVNLLVITLVSDHGSQLFTPPLCFPITGESNSGSTKALDLVVVVW